MQGAPSILSKSRRLLYRVVHYMAAKKETKKKTSVPVPSDITDSFLVAKIYETGTDSPRSHEILKVIKERIGLNLGSTSGHGTWVYFPNVTMAERWVAFWARYEKGILVGREQDSLVRVFPWFRFNESLWNLLNHVIADRVTRTAKEGKETWLVDVRRSTTPEGLTRWFREQLDIYGLDKNETFYEKLMKKYGGDDSDLSAASAFRSTISTSADAREANGLEDNKRVEPERKVSIDTKTSPAVQAKEKRE